MVSGSLAVLAASWCSYFAIFFLAALACGALSRRGFLPLHISAIMGSAAYVFGALCGAGWSSFLAAIAGLVAAAALAAITGTLFWTINGAAASLACMAIQMLFDQYVRSAGWTGSASGLWQGIPIVPAPQRIGLTAAMLLMSGFLYSAFQGTAGARYVVVGGHAQVLAAMLSNANSRAAVILAAVVCGVCAGAAGIVMTLQTVIVSPSSFSLHGGLLYVSHANRPDVDAVVQNGCAKRKIRKSPELPGHEETRQVGDTMREEPNSEKNPHGASMNRPSANQLHHVEVSQGQNE